MLIPPFSIILKDAARFEEFDGILYANIGNNPLGSFQYSEFELIFVVLDIEGLIGLKGLIKEKILLLIKLEFSKRNKNPMEIEIINNIRTKYLPIK
jgi:hypothetical protein